MQNTVYNDDIQKRKEEKTMEIKEILRTLREKKGMTQEQLADKVLVSRQAVSRWETGETQPNTDTLKLLSKTLDASINTLLGSPRQLICQCCGMPLYDDAVISRETDGAFNEEYCKWCYADGNFTYEKKEDLVDFLMAHMPSPDSLPEQDRRNQYDQALSQLNRWKQQAAVTF